MVSAQYLIKYLMKSHQIWYTEGKVEFRFKPFDLDLIFKVTKII